MKEAVKEVATAIGEASEKLSQAQTGEEVLQIASAAAGTELDRHDIATTMRSIAQAELSKHGFPDWAINSVFLGETVCW